MHQRKLMAAALLGAVLCSPAWAAQRLYFISDLHLGVGRDSSSGAWSTLEDFRWHDDLTAWLDHISTQSDHSAHLVVLGDMLELWQSHRTTCTTQNGALICKTEDCTAKDSGCTQQEALERTRNIVTHHSRTLQALGSFANRGSNRLTMVPGNHDAALLMPAIGQELLRAIGARADRATIAQTGYWYSDDGRILAEHGHQFDKVNSFDGWPEPFSRSADSLVMRRPWGEQMVQSFYNRYEYQFQAIDNFESESKGIGFALRALGRSAAASGGGAFLKFLLLDTTFSQKRDFLDEEPPQTAPAWDLEAIRKSNDPRLLALSVDPLDPLSAVLQDLLAAGELPVRPADLSDDELDFVCTRAEALAQGAAQDAAKVVRCQRKDAPDENLGWLVDKILKRDDENLAHHLWSAREQLQKQGRARPGVYVYGHTHAAKPTHDLQLAHDWNIAVANTGAFQRIATDEFILGLGAAANKPDFLATLRLEDVPACYPFVTIADPAKPDPVLRYWGKQSGSNDWSEVERCPVAKAATPR